MNFSFYDIIICVLLAEILSLYNRTWFSLQSCLRKHSSDHYLALTFRSFWLSFAPGKSVTPMKCMYMSTLQLAFRHQMREFLNQHYVATHLVLFNIAFFYWWCQSRAKPAVSERTSLYSCGVYPVFGELLIKTQAVGFGWDAWSFWKWRPWSSTVDSLENRDRRSVAARWTAFLVWDVQLRKYWWFLEV